VTWATSVPILVFLGLSVLDLGPMYATDRRQTDGRRASPLNAPAVGAGIKSVACLILYSLTKPEPIIIVFLAHGVQKILASKRIYNLHQTLCLLIYYAIFRVAEMAYFRLSCSRKHAVR